jgi:hypothetical protein
MEISRFTTRASRELRPVHFVPNAVGREHFLPQGTCFGMSAHVLQWFGDQPMNNPRPVHQPGSNPIVETDTGCDQTSTRYVPTR